MVKKRVGIAKVIGTSFGIQAVGEIITRCMHRATPDACVLLIRSRRVLHSCLTRTYRLRRRSREHHQPEKPTKPEVAITTFMAPDLLTSRLRLRKWREEDLTPFAEINEDPRVMEFFPKTLTRIESDAFAERICAQLNHHPFGLWAVEILQQAQFIGFVGLAEPTFKEHFTPCVEIGWRLGQEYWGRGYALEAAQRVIKYAFEDLCLSELVSFTAVNNLRSQMLMQRLGLSSDASDDFEHPSLSEGHPLRKHVLYRLRKVDWSRMAAG
jgi:RimJ/RimL family protein N-acetyltransferase